MIWSSAAEHANITYPAKFREMETGFAIMGSLNITGWKPDMRMNVWIGVRGNDSTLFI